MLVIFFERELLNWGNRLLHRFPVRVLRSVNGQGTVALSEGQRPTAKHLEAVWWLFVALSSANEGSPEIYVSKVVFLFTQWPAGPSVSTAPVHPPDCFMIDPNRLINHNAGHYTHILLKTTGTCSVLQPLLSRIMKQLFTTLAFLPALLAEVWCPMFLCKQFLLLILNFLFLTIILWSHLLTSCSVYSTPHPHTFFPAYQGYTRRELETAVHAIQALITQL